MKLKFFASFSAVLLLVSQPLFAALDLELTKGVRKPIPIAVMPFATNGATPSTDIGAVIGHDLQYSGRFYVANNQQFSSTPSQLSQIDFGYWQKYNLNAIVIGQVNQTGNQYQVTFSLVSLFNNANASSSSNNSTTVAATPAPTSTAATPASAVISPATSTAIASPTINASASMSSAATSTAANNAVLATQTFTASGSDLRKVAHQIANMIYQNQLGEQGYFTSKIAFIAVNNIDGSPASYSLQTADYDGYNIHTLVSSTEPIMSPSWSPKGNRIAYVAYSKNGQSSVKVINTDGGGVRTVSNTTGLNNAPTWSPDGSQLALVLSKTGNPNIYLYNVNGGQLTPVTQDGNINTEPTFSPDGKSIIFTSNKNGSPQLYQITLAGGTVQAVSNQGTYNTDAQVSTDGSSLSFLQGDGTNFNVAAQDMSTGSTNTLTRDGLVQSTSIAPNGEAVIYSTTNNNHQMLGIVTIDGAVNYFLPINVSADLKEPTWGPAVG